MEEEKIEEYRVLFAAAEQGRADIINTVAEALAAKQGGQIGKTVIRMVKSVAIVLPEVCMICRYRFCRRM